jgi:prepilin-type processing-associated H-X9-DG protein
MPGNVDVDGRDNSHWVFRLNPYVKNGTTDKWAGSHAQGSVYSCPSAAFVNGNTIYTYGMNSHIGPVNWSTNPPSVIPTSLASFTHPAETILIGDATMVGVWNNPGAQFNWWPGQYDNTNFATNDTQWALIDKDPANVPDPAYQQPRYRHSLMANFVWGDGHAKAVRRGGVKVPLNWAVGGDGTNNDWAL